jgi:hypothetical protein
MAAWGMSGTSSVVMILASVLATTDWRRRMPGGVVLGEVWCGSSAGCSASLGSVVAAEDGDASGTQRASSAGCTTSG